MSDNQTGIDVLAELDHWLSARPPWPFETSAILIKRARDEIQRLRTHSQSFYLAGREAAFEDAIIACENRYAFACAEAIRALKRDTP